MLSLINHFLAIAESAVILNASGASPVQYYGSNNICSGDRRMDKNWRTLKSIEIDVEDAVALPLQQLQTSILHGRILFSFRFAQTLCMVAVDQFTEESFLVVVFQ